MGSQKPKTQEKNSFLDGLIEQRKERYPSALNGNKDKIFEFFCVETLLGDYDLTYEEIQSGIVDGSMDGGIDAAFVFVNKKMHLEDQELSELTGRTASVHLILIQSKNTSSFTQTAVVTLTSSLKDLLDFDVDEENLSALYNKEVVKVFVDFRRIFKILQKNDVHIESVINFYYCSRASSVSKFSKDIAPKTKDLKKTIKKEFGFTLDAELLGASELYEYTKRQKTLTKYLSSSNNGGIIFNDKSYIVLCKISDYFDFVTDANKEIIPRLLEANVRAYHGTAEVNREMRSTLLSPPDGVDFWWLNNGITIVSDEAGFQGSALKIVNPLIVNGLQTTHEIHGFLKAAKIAGTPIISDQQLLVRIVVESDPSKRSLVIKATNRQTSIKASSFRATDIVHQKIEDYFINSEYYYDRRKNFYKNANKKADQIITIDSLAQSLASVVGQSPHFARGKPSAIVSEDIEYNKYFTNDSEKMFPMDTYLNLVLIRKIVEEVFLEIKERPPRVYVGGVQQYLNNLKFHVLMVFSWAINGGQKVGAHDVASFYTDERKKERACAAIAHNSAVFVFERFEELGAQDKTAKDKSFTATLQAQWSQWNTTVAVG